MDSGQVLNLFLVYKASAADSASISYENLMQNPAKSYCVGAFTDDDFDGPCAMDGCVNSVDGQ